MVKTFSVLVLIDQFSKYVETKVVERQSAEEVKEFLLETFARYGIPQSVLTDNATSFKSRVATEVYESLGIKGKSAVPYNPTSNGVVERVLGN